MKVIRVKDYQELGKKAAAILIEHVKANPDAVLGLATGSTPQTTYRELIRDHKENGTSYRNVTTVNLDEYIGLSPEDPNSYHYFMKKELFDAIDIMKENTHLPNGEAADLEAECRRYDELIRSVGGIDLQLLGIGRNGHIGFNEPGTSFQTRTHVVMLAEDTRKANARFFPSLDAVPKSAITMGIQNILESRRILLLASGPAKAEAMARLLNQREITEAFPASCLHLHDDVTVIADEAALALVD